MLEMWHWAQRRFMLHATMKIAHRFRLSDMRLPDSTQMENYDDENRRGDLTVMVAAILPIAEEQLSGVTPRGFLRVWDGTGIPKSDVLPIHTEQARESVRAGDPPLVSLIAIAKIILQLQKLRENPDLQPPKALSGRVANVAIWEKQHWNLITESIVTLGSFIRLRNVQDSLFHDTKFRCLHVHKKSSFTPLPNLTYEVIHLLEEHNNRLLRKEPINPDSGILPLFFCGSGPCSDKRNKQESQLLQPHIEPGTAVTLSPTTPSRCWKLCDFLAAPVQSTFVGDVRIVALYPALSILSDRGLESICPKHASGNDRFYRFGLKVQHGPPDVGVDVIVSEDRPSVRAPVGESLFGLAATVAISNTTDAIFNFQKLLQENHMWKVHITSVVHGGCKYFLLDSMEK
jgi:hypothetical protein